MKDVVNYELRNAEAEAILRKIGELMKASCPPGWGFAFFLYTFGSGGSFFYIADCERNDMLKMLKEFEVKLKGN